MTLNENTIQAKSLVGLFKCMGNKGLNVSKKTPKNVLKNSSRALAIIADVAPAALSRNSKAVLSKLPKSITIYDTG